MELVADLTLVLLSAIAGGSLAHRLGQPLMVGYILAGVAVGPFTGGFTVTNVHDIEQLAELGAALLLFSLGLELSFRELAPVRAVALAGATLQIVLTAALGAVLSRALGWPWQASIWLGAAISLSSTMVALKTIQTQGRLGTLSSRVMLGILIVQDLAVVPLMILLPEMSAPAGGLIRVVIAIVRAVALVGIIVFVATRVVPPLMAWVARWNSRELFLLSTTAVALGVGSFSWWLGLTPALGAFVAGLVISESEYAHQALSDVMPLRDLFGMLFFVSVGMLLDPLLVWAHLGALLAITAAVILGKASILAVVVRAFGYRNIAPLAVGLTLFQVGEFAFVLARAGRASGAIPDELYALVLNTAIATMVLTPVVSGLAPGLYARFWPKRGSEALQLINLPPTGLSDHIVVAGGGRVGRGIADALAHLNLPAVLIELDDRHVQHARLAGLPVVFGDAVQPVVLEAAGIRRARAILVTVPAFPDVRAIVRSVQQLRADLPIIARADSHDAVQALYALGIQEITSPEFEAAIEMTRQALLRFNVPAHEILRVASAIRRERYKLGDAGAPAALATSTHISEVARHLEFTWLELPSGTPFDGRTLEELRIRTATGASIAGIIHRESLVANPDGQARLRAGDLVGVLGTRDQIARFERAAEGVEALASA
jgi:CPA2 family monovalent cation:H+ antiporter-2